MTLPAAFIASAAAFMLCGALFRKTYPGLTSIYYALAFCCAILAAVFVSVSDARADTVAHANGANNRMLILTDDKCPPNGTVPTGHIALVLSFYKQPNKDAPGYIVADGCWTRPSDLTVVIQWRPDGYAEQYDARRFSWKGEGKK